MTDPDIVQLVVRVARYEEQTVPLEVERQDGETAEDLAWRYDSDISAGCGWDGWDLLNAEVRP